MEEEERDGKDIRRQKMTEGKREEGNMKISFTDLKLGSDI